jgi:hypothetical protein
MWTGCGWRSCAASISSTRSGSSNRLAGHTKVKESIERGQVARGEIPPGYLTAAIERLHGNKMFIPQLLETASNHQAATLLEA